MNASPYLSDHFLVAMPNLQDPNFAHTVTYLCQHNEEGALGIVINRPTTMRLGDILRQMDITPTSPEVNDIPIFAGGPVQPERGFVIHSPDTIWDSTLVISPHIALTTSRDILEALARNEGPSKVLIALGYAGWGSGQLEQEMIDNAWLVTPSADSILFDTPVSERWSRAASQLGINITQLTAPAGHG